MKAEFGAESAGGAGSPVSDVTQRAGSVPDAFTAVQPAGSAGAVTLSKFSLKTTLEVVHVGVGDAVAELVAVAVLVGVVVFVAVAVLVSVAVSVGVGDAVAVLVAVAQGPESVKILSSHPLAKLPKSPPTSSTT